MAILPKATINDIVNEVVESKLSGHPITSAAIVSDILMKRHGIPYSQAKDLAYRTLKKNIQKIDSCAWVTVVRRNPQRRRMDITSPEATPRSNVHSQPNPTLPTNTNTASSIVQAIATSNLSQPPTYSTNTNAASFQPMSPSIPNQAHVNVSPKSIPNTLPNHRMPPSNTLKTFISSEANKQYCKSFFDTSIKDEGVRRIIDHCSAIREKQFGILQHPNRSSMPMRIQDNIMGHIQETQNVGGLLQDANVDLIEQFTLNTFEMFSPTLCSHPGVVKVLSGRLGFEELKGKGGVYSIPSGQSLPINGIVSVNLEIKIPDNILSPVLSKIDPALVPTEGDTDDSLIGRISRSSYLDEITSYYPRTKKQSDYSRSKLTRQNGSKGWRQPKRRSESIVVKPEHVYEGGDGEGIGREVMTLFNYTSYGRYPDDWRARPMDNATMNLLLYAWMVTWPYLTYQSRKTPPTHMQLLFYYVTLSSRITAHRDNISIADINKIINGDECGENGHPSAGADNSQQIGSNVLVYTEGNVPQNFILRYPSRDNFTEKRALNKTIPIFQFRCGRGTISVLDPVDDLLMTHEACFDKDAANADGYRLGFTIRWLGSSKDFYTDTCGMRLDDQALATVHRNKKWSAERRADAVFPEHNKNIRT